MYNNVQIIHPRGKIHLNEVLRQVDRHYIIIILARNTEQIGQFRTLSATTVFGPSTGIGTPKKFEGGGGNNENKHQKVY